MSEERSKECSEELRKPSKIDIKCRRTFWDEMWHVWECARGQNMVVEGNKCRGPQPLLYWEIFSYTFDLTYIKGNFPHFWWYLKLQRPVGKRTSTLKGTHNPSIPICFFAKQQFHGSFRQIKFVVSLFLVYLISNSFSASCCSWTSRVHNFRQYCCECPQWHHRVAQPEANSRRNYSYVQGPHDSIRKNYFFPGTPSDKLISSKFWQVS